MTQLPRLKLRPGWVPLSVLAVLDPRCLDLPRGCMETLVRLVALADRRTGEVRSGAQDLARTFRMRRETLLRDLNALRDGGWIDWDKPKNQYGTGLIRIRDLAWLCSHEAAGAVAGVSAGAVGDAKSAPAEAASPADAVVLDGQDVQDGRDNPYSDTPSAAVAASTRRPPQFSTDRKAWGVLASVEHFQPAWATDDPSVRLVFDEMVFHSFGPRGSRPPAVAIAYHDLPVWAYGELAHPVHWARGDSYELHVRLAQRRDESLYLKVVGLLIRNGAEVGAGLSKVDVR
jgi:hypothetical protein